MNRPRTATAADTFFVPRIRGLRESAFWVLAGLALILLLALLSYSPLDPAFSVSGDGAVSNRMGPAGAWFADIAFVLFGESAYLFPVLVLIAGVFLFRSEQLPAKGPLIYRAVGFVLAVATSSGLATLHFDAPQMRETAGGILGQVVGRGLEQGLGLLGATVLLLVLWLAAVSLATGVSWVAVMDRTGRAVYRGVAELRERWSAVAIWLEGRRAKQHREEVVSKVRAKPKASAPRIEPTIEKVEVSARAEREKERERQVPLFEPPESTELPSMSLLDDPPPKEGGYSAEALEAMSRLVEIKLNDFGVEAEVVAVHPGPVVTRFELKPAAGVKSAQISSLAKDLARSLATVSVRVVEIIPGKPYVGLEIPNEVREIVALGEIVKSHAYDQLKSPLTLALGKDIGGQPVVADLARMPHLLIAGTTGSGKSVGLNAMVLSLLYKSTPEQVRLIMIDPKMLELSVYEGIPHLLAPVVTDMKQAANALRWCVAEMERRYALMAGLGVRHLSSYNKKVADAIDKGEPLRDPTWKPDPLDEGGTAPELQTLPFIVIIIDELADMMMMVGKKVEELIARLAQKARASGIHMIVATQRPSVDVITGLIKANIPCRIAFQVSAKVDSRTILDQMGAEHLLGHGDMLYLPSGTSMPTRVHGAFVSDNEVHQVVKALRASGSPSYIDDVLEGPSGEVPGLEPEPGAPGELDGEQDALYDQAVRIVTETRKASISGIQRRLKIGYNRAARMVETMEEAGIVGSLQTNGFREVLAPPPPGVD
ncbi:MAG TPA: DNA translocase FtsK 4TM domain-containing protein [Gammaproteobacteria bacterium]|nr:DNA translocase FtsK 4TM domain-containing protein [Gammaproteobacteria bacterium]